MSPSPSSRNVCYHFPVAIEPPATTDAATQVQADGWQPQYDWLDGIETGSLSPFNCETAMQEVTASPGEPKCSDGHRTSEDEDVDKIRQERKARRQAQNRAAQRAFRDRKEIRLQALDGEIEGLNKQIHNSQTEIAELKAALKKAHTQLDTLRSILPTILQPRSPEAITTFDLVQDQECINAMMNFQLSRVLQGVAAGNVSRSQRSTPESYSIDEGAFPLGGDWRS